MRTKWRSFAIVEEGSRKCGSEELKKKKESRERLWSLGKKKREEEI